MLTAFDSYQTNAMKLLALTWKHLSGGFNLLGLRCLQLSEQLLAYFHAVHDSRSDSSCINIR